MRKVIYIAFVMVGLLAVSCSKENIRPNSTESEAIPVWKSSSTTDDENLTPAGPGSITDPNNDEGGGKRKRQ